MKVEKLGEDKKREVGEGMEQNVYLDHIQDRITENSLCEMSKEDTLGRNARCAVGRKRGDRGCCGKTTMGSKNIWTV